MDLYLIKMGRSGFLYNKNGSEWLGVDLYLIKNGSEWLGVDFLYNENGSEWLGVDLYLIKMGRSGSEWICILKMGRMARSGFVNKMGRSGGFLYNEKWVGVARSGFVFNKNGSEWLGVDLYLIKMGRSGEWLVFNKNGSEWICI